MSDKRKPLKKKKAPDKTPVVVAAVAKPGQDDRKQTK